MIKIRHLSKIFQKDHHTTEALSDISLTVNAGRIMGIIGESGAGKSTLIRCVNLLERPTQGEIYVDNQNLLTLSNTQLTKLRQNIGMIFQYFNLFSARTVAENVAFPLELKGGYSTERKSRVSELLELVSLSDKANVYPANLSGGQKQRVAIARALANHPKVLLCDEATSALDPETTHSILSLLKKINQQFGITILLITHEMDVVKEICDEVAILSKGKLIEQGTVAEIFSHPKEQLTHRFISSSTQIQIPFDYQKRLTDKFSQGKHLLISMEISGQSAANSVLSEVMKLYSTQSNIICAQLSYVGGVKFGSLLIEIEGREIDQWKAIEYFKNKNIYIKVHGYI